MSMSIYTEMQKIADELLSDPEFNQGGPGKIEYVRVVPGSGPVDNPGPSTFVSVAVSGVCRGVSGKYVRDGLAIASDRQVTIPVIASITPNMRDFFDIDGIRHKIVEDISTPAAGVRVVWKFIIRKLQ